MTWAAGNWDPDDPRIEELATEVAEHFIADPSLIPTLSGLRNREDGDTRKELLTHHGEDQRPGWTRLTTLIEQKVRAAGVDIP
ncbi:hypothetical protein ACIRYZ_09630 [Kitasatospora sp. NPDC101155]|uniref:hypothetical protein n=1 Tax=Kitasatospora sp. NPDC101155 TaxID=3364097 RepID=UPI003806A9D3